MPIGVCNMEGKGPQGVGFLFFNLMKDPKGVHLFRDFLKVHGAEAPLAFCLDVNKFRAGAPSEDKKAVAIEISHFYYYYF